ncbi:U-box domain-containing protein [Drosera capensis]
MSAATVAAGSGATAGTGDAVAESLHDLIEEVVAISGAGKFRDLFKKDCTDLCRRISLLAHLVDEIRDFRARRDDDEDAGVGSSSSSLSELLFALQNAKRLLLVAGNFESGEDGASRKIAFKFQCVTWKLEKALCNIPFEEFGISEEVQEQVELVRAQLRRATQRYGPTNSGVLSRASSQPLLDKEFDVLQVGTRMGSLHIDNIGNVDHVSKAKTHTAVSGDSSWSHISDSLSTGAERVESSSSAPDYGSLKNSNRGTNGDANSFRKSDDGSKKMDSVVIPEDFLCPISLEIMRDPVIVATGQTYERSYIQRWIDAGNVTCPKTQQKLENFTLTTNYVLRSLISQWCANHNIEQPSAIVTGKLKKSDGSFRDVSGDIAAIQLLVQKLSGRSVEERQSAVRELRSLSKRSTDNRILIAEAGAIPVLVNLLTTDDTLIQENAVTSILNLSIYENNKGLIMLAGAIPSIVQVLRNGSMEARENAAATLFSLSLADENKIIIGASGAIPALVELLQDGSPRGKKDAATALFNLCIYQGNKGRAVRSGIITALLKMLTESSGSMVDEALTILSVLAGHQEAKVAVVRAGTLPVLIDLMRTGLPRNKENAAAILLALCKRDTENLASLGRLGAGIPLMELAKSGTERAQRKATSLLELLRKKQQL